MRLQRQVRGPDGPARGLVVWLHGLGASSDDFVPVVPLMQLPDVRFVFPQAPDRPVTLNGGWVMPAWYDIRHLEPGPEREDVGQVRELMGPLWELIREEQQAAGVDDAQTVLAGFSQGGATALFAADRHDRPLAGLMVLSAYELAIGEPLSPVRAQTPALFCHGSQDLTVPVARGQAAHARSVEAGREASWFTFPMGHEVHPRELMVIRDFLRARLAPPAP